MNSSGTIILTSIGLSSENVYKVFAEMASSLEDKSVAIITTAADGKEENKYSKLAKQQFQELGFNKITFIDLEEDAEPDLSKFNVVYVCGGNTYKLLKHSKDTGLGETVKNLLTRNGIYIGVSAGGIILGPDINISGEVLDDPNEVEIEDLSGFNIIDFVVLPHFENDLEEKASRFAEDKKLKVEKLRNNEAIIVKDGKTSRL